MLVSTSHCDSLPSFDFFPMENSKRSHVDDDGGASFRVDTPVGGPPLNRMKTRVVSLFWGYSSHGGYTWPSYYFLILRQLIDFIARKIKRVILDYMSIIQLNIN